MEDPRNMCMGFRPGIRKYCQVFTLPPCVLALLLKYIVLLSFLVSRTIAQMSPAEVGGIRVCFQQQVRRGAERVVLSRRPGE